jgi:TRAP-type C4-dicarboxylate transport system substrate-binding protein
MPLSEVFVALQTGVIDGQENPIAQVWSNRFHEVQEYLSMTGHVYTPAYLVAGTNRWSQLPEDIRGVIESTAREIQDFAYSEAERMESDLLRQLESSGIRINTANREEFLEASRPIYEEFGRIVAGGADLVDRATGLRAAPAGF